MLKWKFAGSFPGKVIAVGDMHSHTNDNINGSGKGTRDLLEDLITTADALATGSRGDEGNVIQMGDLYDLHLPDKPMENFVAQLMRHCNAQWLGISGNHDYPPGGAANEWNGAQGSSPNSLLESASEEVYRLVDLHYADFPDARARVFFCPFMRREEDFISALEAISDNEDACMGGGQGWSSVLVMHQDIQPVIKSSSLHKDEVAGYGFDIVLNGHIHGLHVEEVDMGHRKTLWVNTGASCAAKHVDHEISPCLWEIHCKEATPHPVNFNWWKPGLPWHREPKPTDAQPPVFREPVKDTTKADKQTFLAVALGKEVPADILPPDLIGAEVKDLHLVSVDIEGFRSWAEPATYQLDLEGGLNIIRAKVGAGKSSIFEAIYWCLTGGLLKEGATQDDIPTEEHLRPREWKGTRVILTLVKDGEQVRVARHIGYKDATFKLKGGNSLLLQMTDSDSDEPQTKACTDPAEILGLPSTEVDTVPKLTKKLCEWLGVTKESFTSSILFDPKTCRIAEGTQAELREIFERLMGTKWIDEMKANADLKVTALQLKANNAFDTMTRAEAKLKGHLESTEAIRESHEQALAKATERWAQAEEKRLAAIPDLEADILDTKADIEAATIAHREALETFKALEGETLAPHPQEAADALQEAKDKETEVGNELHDLKRQHQQAKERKPEQVDTVIMANRTAKEAQQKHAAASKDWDNATDAVKRLEEVHRHMSTHADTGTCSTCGQLLKDKVKFDSEVANALKEVETAKGIKEKSWAAMDAAREADDELTQKLHKAEDEAKLQLEDAVIYLAGRVGVKEIEWAEAKKATATAKETFDTLLQTRRDAISKIEAASDKEQKAKTRLEGFQRELEAFTKALEDAQKPTDPSAKEEAQAALDGFLANVPEKTAALEAAVKEATEARQAIVASLEEYTLISRKCAANGPLRAGIVASRLDAINRHAWVWAAAVGTSVEVKMVEGKYKVDVMVEGRPRSSTRASTGQLLTANLILVRAIHALAAETMLRCNVVFLDEPFSNVDPDTIRILSPLLSMGNTSVHCITHAQNMDLQGAHEIRIEGGTREPSRFA